MDRVSICNFALAKVGEQRITSLDDKSKNAILCKLHFQQTLDEVLRNHRWNSAMKRAALGADAEAPAFGYEYQYTLPIDCLRVIRLEEPLDEYRVEGRKLLTDTSPCNILYISRVEDENILDPLLVKVLVIELAIKLAYNLTEVRTMTDGLMEEARAIWIEARSADSHEGTPEVLEYSEWLEARIKGPNIGKAENASFRDIESGT
jgi:hypothetical protein